MIWKPFSKKDEKEELYEAISEIELTAMQFERNGKEKQKLFEKEIEELGKLLTLEDKKSPEVRLRATRAAKLHKMSQAFTNLSIEFKMMADDLKMALEFEGLTTALKKANERLYKIFGKRGLSAVYKPIKDISDFRKKMNDAVNLTLKNLSDSTVTINEEDVEKMIEMALAKVKAKEKELEVEKQKLTKEQIKKVEELERKASKEE